MKLIIEYYNPPNEERQKEYDKSVQLNIDSNQFDEIIIFLETGSTLPDDIKNNDIVTVIEDERKTFQDLFNYCNQNLDGEICVISNTDIHFDTSLDILKQTDLTNILITLTRWDLLDDGQIKFFNRVDSQDSWIFKSPIKIDDADFHMGKPGCDNKMVYLGVKHNMKVINPSFKIISKHLHSSKYRTYVPNRDTVPPPWCIIAPSYDMNTSKIMRIK